MKRREADFAVGAARIIEKCEGAIVADGLHGGAVLRRGGVR